MPEWTESEIAGVVAAVLAAGQWLAAPWRDLGVVTLCACGAALVLARGVPSPWAAGLVLVAVGIAALAWNRGARRGVGRPGLDGVGLVAAAVAAIGPWVLPEIVPPGPRERAVEMLVVLVGLTASIGFALALERPGPRRTRKRWFRRVPVVEHPPEARGEGSAPEPEPESAASEPETPGEGSAA